MSEPKEFWIEGASVWDETAISPKVLPEDRFIHVIEYSAYEAIKAENDKLLKNWDAFAAESNKIANLFYKERDILLDNKRVDEDIKKAYLEYNTKLEQELGDLKDQLIKALNQKEMYFQKSERNASKYSKLLQDHIQDHNQLIEDYNAILTSAHGEDE